MRAMAWAYKPSSRACSASDIQAAPVLGFVLARKTFAHNGKPNRWAPFDAGA